MTNDISDNLLSQLSEFVTANIGLRFPKKRWRDLERGIHSAAQELGFKDTETCIQQLFSSRLNQNQVEVLASHLTVGETYFFREEESFEILREEILSKLISSRRQMQRNLRIWSAGCSTGEEPYSIAILLRSMIPDLKNWNITILATDINPHFLRKASGGIYGEWSFRNTPAWVKTGYFKKVKDNCYRIAAPVKKMVTFAYHNLVEDTYPSLLNNTYAMDIIFCRNVLMYFSPELVKRVTKNISRSLVDGGWFMVSSSETSHIFCSQFDAVSFPGKIIYRKHGEILEEIQDFSPGPAIETEVRPDPDSDIVSMPEPKGALPKKHVEPPSPTRASTSAEKSERKETITPQATPLELYQQGRYEEVANAVLSLVSQNQETSEMLALLVRACANQGKLTEALSWCEKAVASEKSNPGLHYLHAMILVEQGAFDEAIISLRRSLYLDHNFLLAHFALGNIYHQQGMGKETERHLGNALALLGGYREEEILPNSEGITAGRLSQVITSMRRKEESGL